MNHRCILQCILIVLTGCVNAAELAHEQVTVSFTNPAGFRDFGSADYGPQQGQAELQQLMQNTISELAVKYLPAQQSLQIEFTDIDMAGELVPGHQTADLPGRRLAFDNPDAWQRIVDRQQPPMLQFIYTLSPNSGSANSAPSDSGETSAPQQVSLRDGAFMSNIRAHQRQHFDAELAFESMLLRDWFRATFAAD